MKKFIALITIVLFTSIASAQDCKNFFVGGVYPTTSEPTTIICHKRYAVGFSTARHTPLWSAEVISPDNVKNDKATARKDDFRPDPNIHANQQADIKAFVGTGYDKGHLSPFEDFGDDAVASDESFFMTNMMPQVAANNRGIWRSLEGNVRKVAAANVTYVITGPIFDGTVVTLKDGTPIPTRMFKVAFVPSTHEAFTVIIPNAAGLPASTLPMYFSTVQNLKIINRLVDVNPTKAVYQDQKSFK